MKHLVSANDNLRYSLVPLERVLIARLYIPVSIGYIAELWGSMRLRGNAQKRLV